MASGTWERGEPGGLYWLRTGWPVAFSMAETRRRGSEATEKLPAKVREAA
jgi:hypothetical protein